MCVCACVCERYSTRVEDEALKTFHYFKETTTTKTLHKEKTICNFGFITYLKSS